MAAGNAYTKAPSQVFVLPARERTLGPCPTEAFTNSSTLAYIVATALLVGGSIATLLAVPTRRRSHTTS